MVELNSNSSEEDVRQFCIEYKNTHSRLSQLKSILIQHDCFTIVNNWRSNLIYDYPFGYKLYWFINYITEFPHCIVCGKEIPKMRRDYSSTKRLYDAPFCDSVCANRSSIKNEKIKQTNLQKFGCEYTLQSQSVKEKSKKTNLEKYGCEYAIQSTLIKEKVKQTNLEKYGCEYVAQSSLIKEKVKQTNLEKYGCEYVSQSSLIKEKSKKTNLEKYGCINPMQNMRIRERFTNTMIEKYGVKNALEKDTFKNKMKQTILTNYGVENPFQSEEVKKKMRETFVKKYGVDWSSKTKDKQIRQKTKYAKMMYHHLINDKHSTPQFTEDDIIENYINVDGSEQRKPLKFKCNVCGNDFYECLNKTFTSHRHHVKCKKCYPTFDGTSSQEKELFNYIKGICFDTIEENNRLVLNNKELDIFIPNRNLAIEYCGLYWHSNEYKLNDYHLDKTICCEKQDIHLIHIFENEWIYKQDIVKQYLKSLLGVYDKTIYARKCIVKEIDNKLANEFLEEHHLQGKVPSTKVALGLYFEDEIVACMTFCKSRVNKNCEWELSRFVCKGGYHIPGGASKLLTYFERNYKPKSLVSYADRRWSYSKNNLYLTLSFELISYGKPDYLYFYRGTINLEHKMNFRKDKIKKKFPEIYDEKLTETEMMDKLGYFRIYDCGHLTFIKKYI